MSGEESAWLEDHLPEWLAACDEAIAEGSAVLPLNTGDPPAALRERLAEEVEWCRFVRRNWVRSATGPDDTIVLPPFRRLGRYEVRRALGHGAFGVVFLGFDPELRREVALKVPRPEAVFTSDLRARFRREARAAASLDHPNIVPVYDAGEDEDVCFIASAYCPGITLAEWLRQQQEPIAPRTAASLVVLLAGAVEHAHRRGILHRDLKPGNVLLVKESGDSPLELANSDHGNLVPRITDFGLAKSWGTVFDPGDPTIPTLSGAIIGTPCYMAPEQAEGGGKRVGQQTDVYALGAILYELLTGRPPYRADYPLETLTLVRAARLKPPSSLRAGLPSTLEKICLTCLERDPARRYPSAGALAEDLRRFLDGPHEADSRIRVREWFHRGPGRLSRGTAAVALGLGALAVTVLIAIAAAGRGARPEGSGSTGAFQYAWSFSEGSLPPGATTYGTELLDSKPDGHYDGIILNFKDRGDAWLQVPFTLENDPRSNGARRGRWLLSVVHHADGPPQAGAELPRAAVTLNGRELWKVRPSEPSPALGVPWWTTTRLDVTAALQNGTNVLRWVQPFRAVTSYSLKAFRIAWEPLVPPEPAQLPSFVWDFGKCNSQGSSSAGVEFFSAPLFKPENTREGCFARFARFGASWLELPLVIPADLPERLPGSWVLTIYHKGTVLDYNQKGFSPVLIALNGEEIFRGPPIGDVHYGPDELWAMTQVDISKQLRPGSNVLRWELLESATTHYWLKSCSITWEARAKR